MTGYSTLTARQPSLCLRKAPAFVKPLVLAATVDQMDSAGDKRAHAVEQKRNVARYVAQICLGPETVTQEQGLLPTEDPLNLTLVYPASVSTVCHMSISASAYTFAVQ